MSSELRAIGDLPDLLSSRGDKGINIFFGAGASKAAPTYGPIWNEIQAGLLYALYDRVAEEGWPISQHSDEDRKLAGSLQLRAETFWRELTGLCGSSVACRSFEVVNLNFPNYNHVSIAELLNEGRCRLAVTTNFDEHVEPLLAKGIDVQVAKGSFELSKAAPAYLKLHGTVSNPFSLAYTLEHYDTLIGRNEAMIELLASRPLVILGYSGYDTDVFPILKEVVKRVPLAVVVRHPGSSGEQPVLELARDCESVHLIEDRCEAVLAVLNETKEVQVVGGGTPKDARSREQAYGDAAREIAMPFVALAIMAAFKLGGYWGHVRKYAWLTHDALSDVRYRGEVGEEDFRRLHLHLAYVLKVAGDDGGARIMLGEARESISRRGGKLSEAAALHEYEAMIQNFPGRDPGPANIESKLVLGQKPSDVIEASMAIGSLGVGHSAKVEFEMSWKIGIAKRREEDFLGAIAAFEQVLGLTTTADVTHLERGHFFLDYGTALYEQAVRIESEEIQRKAHVAYSISEKVTAEIGDWVTNARARLMLARIWLISGNFERARSSATMAMESVGKTGEESLRSRIQNLMEAINVCEIRIRGGHP